MAKRRPNRLTLTQELAALIGQGNQLEREIRAGLREETAVTNVVFRWWRWVTVQGIQISHPAARRFPQLVTDIEHWRTRAGDWLAANLPGTGASIFGLSKFGQTGIGPVGYEYTRLCNSIQCLISVLRDLPELIEKSRGR